MISVTMPRSYWRAVHAALVECALMYDAGLSLLVDSPPTLVDAEDIMQKALPFVSTASAWPAAAEKESAARGRLSLPVPEDMLDVARGCVRELDGSDSGER
jgi:hypothetical protein